MINCKPLIAAVTVCAFFLSQAFAQQSVLQSGPRAAGRAPMYSATSGNFGQPLIVDSGPASGGGAGVGLSELGLTVRGTGNPPYAYPHSGSGPFGANLCDYDATTTNPTGYHYICLSPNANGGSSIIAGNGGASSILPLQFIINGVVVPFGGKVLPGIVNNLGYYSSTGTIISPLATANNGVLVTNGVGVPSISSTLPSGLIIQSPIITNLPSGLVIPSPIFPGLTGPLLGNNGSAISAGTISGNTTVFLTADAGLVPGNCPKIDTHGGIIDSGAPCGTGSGTVSVGTTSALAFYSSSGTTVSPLATANNGLLVTDGSGVPSISSTLPSGLTIPTPAITTPAITGQASFAANPVFSACTGPIVGAGAGPVTCSTTLPSGLTVPSPTLSGSPIFSGLSGPIFGNGSSAITAGTISGNTTKVITADGTLTSGHCAQIDASGGIVDFGAACSGGGGSGTVASGTINNLGFYSASGTTISPLATANSGILVTSGGGVPSIATTAPSGLTIPSAVLSGSPILSAFTGVILGHGGSAITAGTISGNTTAFLTADGSLTSGHCPQIDASGGLVDSGGACAGSALGTVTSVATTCGIGGGPITSSGTASGQTLVNAQTGTSYIFNGSGTGGTGATPDCGKLTTFNNAAAQAVTLAQAGASGFATGITLPVKNIGAGIVTITPTTSTIGGKSSLTLPSQVGFNIVSDGTNYQLAGTNSPVQLGFLPVTSAGMVSGGQDNGPFVAALMTAINPVANTFTGGGDIRFPAIFGQNQTSYYFGSPLQLTRGGTYSCGNTGPRYNFTNLVFGAGIDGVIFNTNTTGPDGGSAAGDIVGCAIMSLGYGTAVMQGGSTAVTSVVMPSQAGIAAQPWIAGDGILAYPNHQITINYQGWVGGSSYAGTIASTTLTAAVGQTMGGITALSRTASASAVLLCSVCNVPINNQVIVSGATPSTYNGTWTVTSSTLNTSMTFTTATNTTDTGSGETVTTVALPGTLGPAIGQPVSDGYGLVSVGTVITGGSGLSWTVNKSQTVNPIILSLGSLVGGSACVAGVHNGVGLTGGTGTLATANISCAGGAVTAVYLQNPGKNYTNGDTLSASIATGFSVVATTGPEPMYDPLIAGTRMTVLEYPSYVFGVATDVGLVTIGDNVVTVGFTSNISSPLSGAPAGPIPVTISSQSTGTTGGPGLYILSSSQTANAQTLLESPTPYLTPPGTTIAAISGPILTIGTITPGSGGTVPGTYAAVTLTGGTGTLAKATIVVTGVSPNAVVSAVTVTSPGLNYSIGDTLSAATGSIGNVSGFSVPVATVTPGGNLATLSSGAVIGQGTSARPVRTWRFPGPNSVNPAPQNYGITTTSGSNSITVVSGPRPLEGGDMIVSDAFPYGATVFSIAANTQTFPQTAVIRDAALVTTVNATANHAAGSGSMWILPAGIKHRTQSRSHKNYVYGFGFGEQASCTNAGTPDLNCTVMMIQENSYEQNLCGYLGAGDNTSATTLLNEEGIFSYIADFCELGTLSTTYLNDNSNSKEEGTTYIPIMNYCSSINFSVNIGSYIGATDNPPGCITLPNSPRPTGEFGIFAPTVYGNNGMMLIAPAEGGPNDATLLNNNNTPDCWLYGTTTGQALNFNCQGNLLRVSMNDTSNNSFGLSYNSAIGWYQWGANGTTTVVQAMTQGGTTPYIGYQGDGLAYMVYPRGVAIGGNGVLPIAGGTPPERLFRALAAKPVNTNGLIGDVTFNTTAVLGGTMGWVETTSASATFAAFGPISLSTTDNIWSGSAFVAQGTKPTLTTGTCSGSSPAGGSTAGSFVAPLCAAGTIILTALPPAPNGYTCKADDETTPSNTLKQQAHTTTSVTFLSTTSASDSVAWSCLGW